MTDLLTYLDTAIEGNVLPETPEGEVHPVDAAFESYFLPGEYTDTTRFFYQLLAMAVREQADTLVLTPTQLVLSRNGIALREMTLGLHGQRHGAQPPAGYKGPWMIRSYRESLQLLLKRDRQVRAHLRIVKDTPDTVAYRLIED
jgi:hypothetical protein